MLDEFVISVQNREGGMGVLFSMSFEPSPDFMRNEKIVGFYLSSERVFGDAEKCGSRVEVVVILRVFV